MTWYTHAPTFADPQTFGASEDFKGIVNNFPAMAGRDAGAPVMLNGGWHPFDMAAIGDGATGEIYSFGADGAVASVETPNFADGFEYALFVDRIERASVGDAVLALYKATDAAYQTVYTAPTAAGSIPFSAWWELPVPRLTKTIHGLSGYHVNASGTAVVSSGAMYDSTPQKIGKARLTYGGGNITAGAIYLYRRGMQQ